MMYSAYKLNQQGDNLQPWRTPFPIWNQSVVPCPVILLLPDLHTNFSKGKSGGLVFPSFQSFPQFLVIHTVKGFGIVNKAEVDVSLELSCFFNDPADVGNMISGSSAFSKSSLNIWKFTVHLLLKPDLENMNKVSQMPYQYTKDVVAIESSATVGVPECAPLGDSGWKVTGYWPWIVKVHIKGVVSMSPDSSIFSFVESSNLRMFVFSLVNLNILVFQPLGFCCKNFCISWLLYASEQSLRATWEAISQA